MYLSLWQTTDLKMLTIIQITCCTRLQGQLLLIQSFSLLEFLWLMIQLMAFSSNIPTHLCRQVAMFSSRDQSMSESVTEALEATPQRSSSPFLETFLLCDTAVRSCFRNTPWPQKSKGRGEKRQIVKVKIHDLILYHGFMRKYKAGKGP